MKGIILTLTMAMGVYGWEPVDAPVGNDRAIVAAVIIAEGGGESKRGMCAIYEVIHTRASHRGTSCATEVMRRKQFSCLNNTSPAGLVRRCQKHRAYITYVNSKGEKERMLIWDWVHDVLLKFIPFTDHTVQDNQKKLNRNRADHYYAHKKIAKPYWVGAVEGKVIGNHKFYKLTK